MNIRQCWEINSKLNAFTIPVRFINPKNKISVIKYCVFDPGFTGYFGLDKKTIIELGLEQIGQGKALTITGDISYENYFGQVELIDEKQSILGKFKNVDELIDKKNIEQIPIQLFRLPLMGIKSITQFSWLILGKKQWICIIDE
jgi:hypothetical protein